MNITQHFHEFDPDRFASSTHTHDRRWRLVRGISWFMLGVLLAAFALGAALAIGALLVLAIPSAWAAGDTTTDDGGIVLELYRAITSGNAGWAAGIVLIPVVTAIRQLLGARARWFRTDLGGVALAVSMAYAAGVAHALIAGVTPWSLALLQSAGRNALVAMGGYVGLRKSVMPALVQRWPWLNIITGGGGLSPAPTPVPTDPPAVVQ